MSGKSSAYAPSQAVKAKAQDQDASDAAAERLGQDDQLKELLQDAKVAAAREAEAPGGAAPESSGKVHILDAKPNPVAGHLTVPRAYLNPASPSLKKGAPTVKVSGGADDTVIGPASIPKVDRRWPVVALVVAGVAGAFIVAVLIGNSTEPEKGAAVVEATAPATPAPPTVAAPTMTTQPQPAATPGPIENPTQEPTVRVKPTATVKASAPVAAQQTTSSSPSSSPTSTASGSGMTYDFKKDKPK